MDYYSFVDIDSCCYQYRLALQHSLYQLHRHYHIQLIIETLRHLHLHHNSLINNFRPFILFDRNSLQIVIRFIIKVSKNALFLLNIINSLKITICSSNSIRLYQADETE